MSSTTRPSGSPRNRVKALLRDGWPAFRVFATIPPVAVVQIMAGSGPDGFSTQFEAGMTCVHAIGHWPEMTQAE